MLSRRPPHHLDPDHYTAKARRDAARGQRPIPRASAAIDEFNSRLESPRCCIKTGVTAEAEAPRPSPTSTPHAAPTSGFGNEWQYG